MMRPFRVFFLALMLTTSATYAQQEVVLTPIRDNTLYEHEAGGLSNGVGEHLFTGRVGPGGGGGIRRAVMAFDVAAAVPEGAAINDVVLTLNMSRTIGGTHMTTLHRLTADWGEGTSDASTVGTGEEGIGITPTTNDATWIHTFFDSDMWAAPGGDFLQATSASQEVSVIGQYTFTSEEMIDDVQQWLDDPSSNFGWILVGNEESTNTTKRFDSRENTTEQNRPRLTIIYSTNTSIEQPEQPTALRLGGNYPNPFVDATTVRFDLERPQTVSLRIYDVLGREVKSLLGGPYVAGPHEVVVSADALPTGTYLYCLEGVTRTCGRMALVR